MSYRRDIVAIYTFFKNFKTVYLTGIHDTPFSKGDKIMVSMTNKWPY